MMLSVLMMLACGSDSSKSPRELGAPKRVLFPFPSMHQMHEGRVDLPEELPVASDGRPVAVDRVRWREGFSVA